MKKVCGYKSLNGRFYELESECEKADLVYKINNIDKRLKNFHRNLLSIFAEIRTYNKEGEVLKALDYLEKSVEEKVCLLIFHHSDDFLKIIKEKEELKSNLEKLENEHRIKNSWWYKFFIQ